MVASHNSIHPTTPLVMHVSELLLPRRPEAESMKAALEVGCGISGTGHGVLFAYSTDAKGESGIYGHAIRIESISPHRAWVMGKTILLSMEAIICQVGKAAGVPRDQFLRAVQGIEPRLDAWQPATSRSSQPPSSARMSPLHDHQLQKEEE